MELIKTRQASLPFAERKVDLSLKMDEKGIEWVITDQGPGFDWTKVPDPDDPENLLMSHGRGIMLTRLQFDEITCLEKGNKVRLVKNLASVS